MSDNHAPARSRTEFLQATGFPKFFADAFGRWNDHLPAHERPHSMRAMAKRIGFADTKPIRNWMQGISAPAAGETWSSVLRILTEAPANRDHMTALDAAYQRTRRRRSEPDPGMAERVREALPVLAAARAPAGATWTSRDDAQLDIDTSPARSDIEAASRPEVAARHESVKRKIRTLLDTLGDRLAACRIPCWPEIGESAVYDAVHSVQPRPGVPAAAGRQGLAPGR